MQIEHDMFSKRSDDQELLDLGPQHYTSEEYENCMQKLFLINKMMGIFQSTVKLLKKLSPKSSVLEIGCGNGQFLLNLSKYHSSMSFHGIDINAHAIQLAQGAKIKWKKKYPKSNVDFSFQKQKEFLKPKNQPDVILTTLVCHHMNDAELLDFLIKVYHCAKQQVIIHDLHRHFLAYSLYKFVSRFFRNRLIFHDGLISIKRGFIRKELLALLKKAGIDNYQIKWCFPFRWRIILWKRQL